MKLSSKPQNVLKKKQIEARVSHEFNKLIKVVNLKESEES